MKLETDNACCARRGTETAGSRAKGGGERNNQGVKDIRSSLFVWDIIAGFNSVPKKVD